VWGLTPVTFLDLQSEEERVGKSFKVSELGLGLVILLGLGYDSWLGLGLDFTSLGLDSGHHSGSTIRERESGEIIRGESSALTCSKASG
jgi:hypothetical protein